jgi:molybdopterin-guanine dinucleotide biosynthesis protein A
MYHRSMERTSTDVSVFILAGGKSTRMGADKAFALLDGRTLLARALDLARSITSQVNVVGSASKFAAFAEVVEDQFPDCGPLGGIHAALRKSSAEGNVMLAVDTPFVSKQLLRFLIDCSRTSPALVTVPRTNGLWQPLCAVYRREFADVAEEALTAGRYKIDALFDRVMVRVIQEKELAAAGFSTAMFRNLNTKKELEQVSSRERLSEA